MRRIHEVRSFTILLIASIGLAGCDNFNAVKDKLTGSGKNSTVKSSPAVQAKTANAPMRADTLARVGSWSISTKEFNERLAALKEVIPEYDTNDPQARQLVLDELVNQQILVLGAERSGLANQSDIKAAVDEFRRTLIVREVARQLTENVTMTEGEARQIYEENKMDWVVGQWHVREIIVETKEQATSILGEILKGADFAQTARLQSKGRTAANGGDLGFITEEPFPQMGNALLSLEEGDVSGVFKGPEGYYIVKLEERTEGAPLSFEEIKEDIIQIQTLNKQQEIILDHLDRLKRVIPVEINEQLL